MITQPEKSPKNTKHLPQLKRPLIKHQGKPSFSIKKKPSFQLSTDYSVFAVAILLLTSLFWAYLGARLQSSNADQLVNSYLFENAKTFHSALLPAAHSFLIKWPVFLLIKLLGSSRFSFIVITAMLSLITVGGLTYILYRIDRRPVVFGTLCLCLASVLLLVPPQPYAGGILPVNMAMLATRNIEYILYIASLVLLLRAPKLLSWNFYLATVCLSLLGASDKLFLTLSLGGAGLALPAYFITRRWALTRLSARWLAASVLAALTATGLLWIINATGLTHISGSVGGSPYALIHTVRSFGLGVVFGVLGVLTNFGANPAFDAAILRNIPKIAWPRLLGPSGISFISNIVIFFIGAFLSVKLYFSTFWRSTAQPVTKDNPLKLAVMLMFSSVAAIAAFIASDHYYVVDARYLTILLFAVFIGAAVYVRKKKFKQFRLSVTAGTVLTVSILIGAYTSHIIYIQQAAAVADINQRNALVAQAVVHHPVDSLLGDYWRTIPIKNIQSKINVTPLDDCTHERNMLSSKSWQTDLQTHSFAYLISFDKSLTNYPSCSLDQITGLYGRPNSSVLIAGKIDKPIELVLFYDQGAHKSTALNDNQTVLPLTPDQIPYTNCAYTLMNIVAHQDDDLLFLSPDLIHDVQAHHCIRTIYVTAGDGGNDQLYWLGRERGSEGAYSKLIGSNAPWVQRTIKMSDNQFITLANPKGNPSISLIFIRLADGSPIGQGFRAFRKESLERLETNKIKTIHSVDGQSNYSSNQLVDVITRLMRIYQPTEIHTQAPSNANSLVADHSDHMAVGRFVTKAYKNYDSTLSLPIKYYIGYPIKKMPVNVSGADLDIKTAAFLAYSQFDTATCHSKLECDEATNYGSYLKRQYQYIMRRP